MNLSGASVAALVREFEADPLQDMLVIYDELDLKLGTFKIRERGSTAGHNGARSITAALGTQEWLRLRIGVGKELPPEAISSRGKTRRQGLPAFADDEARSGGAGRGAGQSGNGHPTHSRNRHGRRDE